VKRALGRLVGLLLVAAACGKDAVVDGGVEAGPTVGIAPALQTLAHAEDGRRSKDVTTELQQSHEVDVRRRAARALARIADTDALPGLLRALSDEDPTVVAWGAYGLGFACKGHEEAHVRALVARSEALEATFTAPAVTPDPRAAIARAVGKCGGPLAEPTLAGWLKRKGPRAEAAALALGDVAARRGTLGDDTVTALLDAAGDGSASALYPFARIDRYNDAFAERVRDTAKKVLAMPATDDRVFAVRALARSGEEAAPSLLDVVENAKGFSAFERADAARGLAKVGNAGHDAAATALGHLMPDKDPFAILALTGDGYAILLSLLGALGPEATKTSQPILETLSVLKAPGEAPAPLARRLAELRCGAAAILAKGAYDSEVLRTCDAPGTQAFEGARLVSLLKRPLVGDRRSAWLALTKSANLRVREDALDAISSHAELGAAALGPLTDALTDAHPGVVATAAGVLHAQPSRVMTLAAKERKAALDPAAPPPSTHPEQELNPAIAKALGDALAKTWSEDLVETRLALLDAAVTVKLPGAAAAAHALCTDPNTTIRERATKALRTLGDAAATCPAPGTMPVAKEADLPKTSAKLNFDFETGKVVITLNAELAPIASQRFLGLAKAGFYKGIVAHRVVPGFVLQFGDPQGDGFGGSGQLLRCETSPAPFGPLDVGVALAGRDTGSSQLFVTLGRFPHLDGDYALIGHASGDPWAIAEGDAIREVTVVE